MLYIFPLTPFIDVTQVEGVRRLATLVLHFSLGGPLLCIGLGGLCEVRAAGGPQQTSGI